MADAPPQVWKGEVAAAPAGRRPPPQLLCFSEEACAEATALAGHSGVGSQWSSSGGMPAADVLAGDDDGVLLVDEGRVVGGPRQGRPAGALPAAAALARPETALVVC